MPASVSIYYLRNAYLWIACLMFLSVKFSPAQEHKRALEIGFGAGLPLVYNDAAQFFSSGHALNLEAHLGNSIVHQQFVEVFGQEFFVPFGASFDNHLIERNIFPWLELGYGLSEHLSLSVYSSYLSGSANAEFPVGFLSSGSNSSDIVYSSTDLRQLNIALGPEFQYELGRVTPALKVMANYSMNLETEHLVAKQHVMSEVSVLSAHRNLNWLLLPELNYSINDQISFKVGIPISLSGTGDEPLRPAPVSGICGFSMNLSNGNSSKALAPEHRTVPADQLDRRPKMDPQHKTVPADQLDTRPKMDPRHRTVPADRLTIPADIKREADALKESHTGDAIGSDSLVHAKSKLKIYLRDGEPAVWLEFDDGWREAKWTEVTDPATGKKVNTYFANLDSPAIKKDEVRKKYSKSVVDCVSEISDSGLGMIIPGMDAWNAFNNGNYGELAFEAGMEMIPLFGKAAGKFIRIVNFGADARHADEVMECAAEAAKKNDRLRESIGWLIRSATGIATRHARAFSDFAKRKKWFVIVRHGNPESLKYHGKGYIPKPVTCKAKTAKVGPDAGLVVNPNAKRQSDAWDEAIENAPSPEAANDLRKARQDATEAWDDFVESNAIRDAYGNISGFKKGYEVDADGIVKKRRPNSDAYDKIHGDYDLHGVYRESDGRKVNMGNGGLGHGNNQRRELNDELNKNGCGDQVQHGSQDDWLSATKKPDLPVTVFKPDGGVLEINDLASFKKFYEDNGFEWPY